MPHLGFECASPLHQASGTAYPAPLSLSRQGTSFKGHIGAGHSPGIGLITSYHPLSFVPLWRLVKTLLSIINSSAHVSIYAFHRLAPSHQLENLKPWIRTGTRHTTPSRPRRRGTHPNTAPPQAWVLPYYQLHACAQWPLLTVDTPKSTPRHRTATVFMPIARDTSLTHRTAEHHNCHISRLLGSP